MSKHKKVSPIQPAPVQRFTVRLVDGHFVRVPKLENLPVTDATRPATVPMPGTAPGGEEMPISQKMRLVNGRFVDVTKPAEAPKPPKAAAPKLPPKPEKDVPADSWAFPFTTRRAPSDPSAKA